MTSRLHAISFDADRPERLAAFWSGLLGWEAGADPQAGVALLHSSGHEFRIRFVPVTAPRIVANRVHVELTSESVADQRETVARALALGARHIDVGRLPEEEHVVLADPGGNEFCVIEPGNQFLAGCGFLGGLSCDGSQAAGYFWSAALGWPLVWDRDRETAVRSPRGGPKIAWGGPPQEPKPARNRVHFDLAPPAGGDREAEVERLLALGATRADIGQGDVGRVVLADPDGNEFCVR